MPLHLLGSGRFFAGRRDNLRLKFMAERYDFGNVIGIMCATDHDRNGDRHVMTAVEFRTQVEGDNRIPIHEAPLQLDMREAQQLIDELWRCGLRPTEGQGSVGQLAATERHLDDMRAMAFSAFGFEQPAKRAR